MRGKSNILVLYEILQKNPYHAAAAEEDGPKLKDQ
jgi:hypothetical protein